MRRAQIIFEIVAMTAIAALAVMFFNELRLLVRDAREDVNQTTAELHATLGTLDLAAEHANVAATEAAAAAAEQRAYWKKTSLETYKTMASLRLTIVRTDRSINDVIAPQVATTLKDTDALSRTAAEELTAATLGLEPSLDNLARASAAAATALADPQIHETLTRVDQTSLELASTARNMDEATTNVDAATRDFAAYVHRMTTPARGAWSFIKELLGIARDARQATGF